MDLAKTPRILVVGDLMVDHYIWGDSTRISPEAPVQIVDVKNENNRLGGACNVAHNLIAMGAKVELCGVIGGDGMGEWLITQLDSLKIGIQSILRDGTRPTIKKTRVIIAGQQVLRIDRESKEVLSKDFSQRLFSSLAHRMREFDGVILSDYNKGVLSPSFTQQLIALARSENKPILCDPKGRDFTKYKGATLLTPNKKEAQIATGMDIVDEKSLQVVAQQLKKDCALSVSLITLSEDGIGILDEQDEICVIPTIAKEVFDVTGAGDTVIAALAFGLACKMDIFEACKFANAAAAVVVSKVGSATASMQEIQQILDPHATPAKKLITLPMLLENLQEYRGKIVFTNGCFDILHRGHLQYLKEARSLGDLLIVGLNSDDSVRRLKGEERPINSQEDRAFMLSGLECVDYIVIFEEDTPLELIKDIEPDILVKGGDYHGKIVVGSEYAKEVVLIDYVPGHSTSHTIQKIRSKKE
ncbi:D-glycero-beta-D-manno-heptose-7-phosphate kinase [Helicobacter mustelae]|uniref:Bifunctional protein HldE n=1 Tax=Helicobacter mustelae (strain ATCC 43772 / CCUG 25715 / CIP 103759 / LMG 18044 / NCTC 12198 / R85-136P) TaxID=679897 RepID=D3UI28_HELM1|nr:D-glycero-beta-D-manno-heptose-7-phosphate kinase [Helicobacter mustelae]CBG40151.1 putative ADP-heptose synthase [Helicobacter mustelae 12198]SQH71653.1 ADP-heptose synthase [Helicobacter mustelae]STP12778.1 ADP-heptose synthase [Helicobacter mustelae]